MNDTPTAGRFLPHSLLTDFLRKHEHGLMWITILSNIALVLSLFVRFYSFLPKYRLNYHRKYGKEPPNPHMMVVLFKMVILSALHGKFFGKLNRTILHDNASQNPMPQKYLLPSLCLSLLMVIIMEVVFRMCDYFLRQPIYQEVPSSIDDGKEDNEVEVDEGDEIDEKEASQSRRRISWPCFWYLFAFGAESLENSVMTRPYPETHVEYLGPMSFTKIPMLQYSSQSYSYDKDYWYPCLEGTPTRGKYHSQILQPSIQVKVEIGWGHSWGCRSKANSKKWITYPAPIDECTSFICRQDGASTCPCYPEKESAWNASLQCVNNAFNLTLLEQNVTFDKQQPPWEDESGWPTLTKYGSCDDESAYLHIADVQYFAPREKRISLYRYFGIFSLIVAIIVAIVKCS